MTQRRDPVLVEKVAATLQARSGGHFEAVRDQTGLKFHNDAEAVTRVVFDELGLEEEQTVAASRRSGGREVRHRLPLVTSARQAKEQGAIFYTLPEDLDPDQIDPLLREIVLNINLSGFCWTAESCQGHPDAAAIGDTCWDHNVEPYLRLVCHQDREGEVLTALMRACDPSGEDEITAIESGYEHPQAARLYRYGRGEYAEIMVYLRAHNVMNRNGGVEVFRRFSKRLLMLRDQAVEQRDEQ